MLRIKTGKKTNSGLLISKSGKLQIPYIYYSENPPAGQNCYHQPLVVQNDHVAIGCPSGILSLKSIGTVLSLKQLSWGSVSEISTLAGIVREERVEFVVILTEGQFQDAKAFFGI